MDSFELFFDFVRAQLKAPKLICVIKPEWGSQCVDYRQKIRLGLTDALAQAGALLDVPSGQEAALRILDQRPRLPGWSLSISHSVDLGGFVICPSPLSIGFDLERIDRVETKTTLRISDAVELAAAPSPAHLWVTKEAAYKSYEIDKQPPFMSAVKVQSWKSFKQRAGSNRDFEVTEASLNLPSSIGLQVSYASVVGPHALCVAAIFSSTLVPNSR